MTETERNKQPLKPDDSFRIACGPVAGGCNHCCRGAGIFLAPYDVLRLTRRMGIPSGEFHRLYTVIPIADAQRYPIVALRLRGETEKLCPFLDELNGCSVYEDRPLACRMYPLTLAEPSEGAGAERSYFIANEESCLGRGPERQWTVREWLASQGVDEYEREGRLFEEILFDQRLLTGPPPPPAAIQMLFVSCYDLDNLRRFVFESKFAEAFGIAPERLEAAKTDDRALAQLGVDYMRVVLFGEKYEGRSMKDE